MYAFAFRSVFDDFLKFQKLKQPLFLGVDVKTITDKAPCSKERAVYAVSTERYF